jgi:hypothetical protein
MGTLRSVPEGRPWRFNLEEDSLTDEEAQAVYDRASQARRKIRSRSRSKTKGAFIFGGPWEQFCLAARLPGKALIVWLLVRHQVRLRGTLTISLPASLLQGAGIGRATLLRALKALERTGLVSVTRNKGRSVRITLIELPEDLHPEKEDAC